MSLELVLGGSGAGKTPMVYENIISESMKNHSENYYIIVPDQFTMETQKNIVDLSANNGTMNIDIISFKRLAKRLFDEAGVNIYMYKKGFLHAKLLVSDDVLSTVGSTNMDFRSFEHNFEINAFMYDGDSAVQLKHVFLSDQKDAELLQLKSWRKRPWYQKVMESFIRLFAPLL